MDEKLRIAIEALTLIESIFEGEEAYAEQVQNAASQALLEIQREHYLNVPSPVVAELIGGRTL